MPNERNTAREPKGAKVIDLGERRKQAERKEIMDSNSARAVSREECLNALGNVAPVPKDLVPLLDIPEKLYHVDSGLGGSTSFSSQPDRNVAAVTGSLLLGLDFPKELPDYGIHISSRGSNVFCTLVDRRRKIIICEDVRNMFAKQGSWDFFTYGLKEVLARAAELESRGEKFSFVISKDSVIRTI
jgi:hypothetical protein